MLAASPVPPFPMSGASKPGRFLLLRGVQGYLRDQAFRLRHGESVVVGRSRKCAVSLQRSDAFAGAAEAGPSFRKTSRRHFRLSFPHPDLVEIENLSLNGTFVDGRKIDKLIISDLSKRAFEIAFGDGEKLVLTLEAGDDGGST